jgi:hypothetical protein
MPSANGAELVLLDQRVDHARAHLTPPLRRCRRRELRREVDERRMGEHARQVAVERFDEQKIIQGCTARCRARDRVVITRRLDVRCLP